MFFDPDEGHRFFRRRLATILGVLVGRNGGCAFATSVAGARAMADRRGRSR
jgi:hypothetical protein